MGKASLLNRTRNASLHSICLRNCGECPFSYASSVKCREQILLHDEGLNFLRLQNSTHPFLLCCWATDFPLGNETKRNVFHSDFFGCHYCNRIQDSTCCALALHASEAAKFATGHITPSQTNYPYLELVSAYIYSNNNNCDFKLLDLTEITKVYPDE